MGPLVLNIGNAFHIVTWKYGLRKNGHTLISRLKMKINHQYVGHFYVQCVWERKPSTWRCRFIFISHSVAVHVWCVKMASLCSWLERYGHNAGLYGCQHWMGQNLKPSIGIWNTWHILNYLKITNHCGYPGSEFVPISVLLRVQTCLMFHLGMTKILIDDIFF